MSSAAPELDHPTPDDATMADSPKPRARRPTCRLLPHGGFPLLIATLSTLAWCASIFEDGCDYALIRGPIVAQLLVETPSYGGVLPYNTVPPYLELGLSAFRHPTLLQSGEWKTDYYGACLEYPDTFRGTDSIQYDVFDDAWTASKALSFLALALGGGATLLLWCFTTCCVFSKATWRWIGYELLLAASCQVASFCWYATNACERITLHVLNVDEETASANTCDLLWGSETDVLAASLWTTCAALALCRYPPPTPMRGEVEFPTGARDGEPIRTTDAQVV